VVVVVVAYVVMAFFNGMTLLESSLTMAMIVGLARGMHRAPGHSYIDEPVADGPRYTVEG